MIGTSKGVVYRFDFITSELLGIYGIITKDKLKTFRNSQVNKIAIIPNTTCFLVMYSDQTIVKYDMKYSNIEKPVETKE